MRDLTASACQDLQSVQRRLAQLIGQFGYVPIDVPVLETTELFMRKSGGSLASQMYSFIDPGSNSVSLRPEFTSAIMRHYLELTGGTPTLPVARWQYAGPVFRYDTNDIDGSGQFIQLGAELVGSDSILADAELLALAAAIPAELGIADYCLRVADLNVLDSVLDTVGLSDRARAFIVANMNRIRADETDVAHALQRAADLNIVAARDVEDEQQDLANAVAGLPDAEAREVLFGYMRWSGVFASAVGQRTPDEIIDRLLRKLRGGDDPDAVERGLKLAAQLASINGSPVGAIGQARALVSAVGADPAAINRLSVLADLVAGDPALDEHVVIDFSLARGIAYYNGIIFDVVSGDSHSNLGGGGRYDALARALGSPANVPALGFAYTMENLMAVTPQEAPSDAHVDQLLIAPDGPDAYRAALRAAHDIRKEGGVAVLDVGNHPIQMNSVQRRVSVGPDGSAG